MTIQCPKCHSDNPESKTFCGDCGTPLQPLGDAQPSITKTLETPVEELTQGTIFAGRYKIIEKLGKGGMGRVYKALDQELNEEVAIKLIKPEIAANKSIIERFKNELKLARKIGHRNVGRMYELMEEEGKPFITMEYIEGEELKGSISKKGRLTEKEALSIARQVCEGLVEAHELGVIHRDLKPQNIMIDEDKHAKIMDFGIARSVEAPGVTQTGVMIGTPDYISPEQAEGEEADERADIYSLGVILYEMVTGHVPFKGDTALSVALKHKAQLPQDPKKLNPDVSEDLSRLILVCMEKNRERRYQTALELLADLKNIEEGFPLGTRIRPRRETFTATLIRRKFFFPALIAALAIIVVIVWRFFPKKDVIPAPGDKPSLAIMYFENNTGDENLDYWSKMLSDLLITDLSQSRYIRVLSQERLYEILSQLNQLEAKAYSTDVLRELASRGGTEHVLLGKYAKMGDTFRIDIVLQEASTGEIIGSERVEAQGEGDVFPQVDELTRRIKTNFQLSAQDISKDIDWDIGKITTDSPEAYRYYSEALKLTLKAEFRQAIQYLERAVALDPNFASAYQLMGVTYADIGYYAERRKYLQKAFELSEGVSERERFQIQGEYYYIFGDTQESIEVWKKLLELYPEDWPGNHELGWIYLGLEEWDKAIERFEVNIQNKGGKVFDYCNQAHGFRGKGQYEKAGELLEDYFNNVSDHPWIRANLAYNYVYQGEYDRALAIVEKQGDLKGYVYHSKGNFTEAEKLYLRMMKSEETSDHFEGGIALVELYLAAGKFTKAEEQAKQGIELAEELGQEGWKRGFLQRLAYTQVRQNNPEAALEVLKARSGTSILHFKGLVYVAMEALEEAQETALELKELVQEGLNQKLMRYYYHLMGMIELENENFSDAIEHFQKALPLLSFPRFPNRLWHDQPLFYDSLAWTYYRTGDFEKAQEEYERIASLNWGLWFFGDIYVKSFYMLGRIFEEKGNKAKAIEHYEKFLDLWKEADPGIVEVDDARKRLAALRGFEPRFDG